MVVVGTPSSADTFKVFTQAFNNGVRAVRSQEKDGTEICDLKPSLTAHFTGDKIMHMQAI